jgi:hypothetical protein
MEINLHYLATVDVDGVEHAKSWHPSRKKAMAWCRADFRRRQVVRAAA